MLDNRPIITTNEPDPFPTEYDRFKDDSWGIQKIRYIAGNFHNYNQSAVFGGSVNEQRTCASALEAYAYFFAEQKNRYYAYVRQLPKQGQSVPTPFVPGMKVAPMINYFLGNCSKMIEPIQENIGAISLDYEVLANKDLQKSLAKFALKHQDIRSALQDKYAVKFQPTPNEPTSEEEIDDDENFTQDEYEQVAIKLARSDYFRSQLKQMFGQHCLYQALGGASLHVVLPKGENTEHILIPSHNQILDFRAEDDHGKNAMHVGGIFNWTPEVCAANIPDLTREELEEIKKTVMDESSHYNGLRAYYNGAFSNMTWYDQKKGTVAIARVWFIVKKDMRLWESTSKLSKKKGEKYYTKIEDDREYDVPDENGGRIKKKGYELRGDKWTWDVMEGILVGNRYLKNFKYLDKIVRPFEDVSFPELPGHFFAHNMINGFYKSLAQRLIPLEIEREKVLWKIRNLMDKDRGKNFAVNGKALGLSSWVDIDADFKVAGLHVFEGDQSLLNAAGTKEQLVIPFDMSLNQSIGEYRNVMMMIAQEMEEAVGITRVAMGQQQDIIGKGVQQATIAQSEMGNITLYDGMMEFFNRILQYTHDLQKQIISTGNKSLVLSKQEAAIVNIGKEYSSKRIGIHIRANDTFGAAQRDALKQWAQALSQNIAQIIPIGYDPIVLLEMGNIQNFDQGIARLKKMVAKNKAAIAKDQMANNAAAAKAQSDMEAKQAELDFALESMKQAQENYRKEIDVMSKNQKIMMDWIGEHAQREHDAAMQANQQQSDAASQQSQQEADTQTQQAQHEHEASQAEVATAE